MGAVVVGSDADDDAVGCSHSRVPVPRIVLRLLLEMARIGQDDNEGRSVVVDQATWRAGPGAKAAALPNERTPRRTATSVGRDTTAILRLTDCLSDDEVRCCNPEDIPKRRWERLRLPGGEQGVRTVADGGTCYSSKERGGHL